MKKTKKAAEVLSSDEQAEKRNRADAGKGTKISRKYLSRVKQFGIITEVNIDIVSENGPGGQKPCRASSVLFPFLI